MSIEFEKCRCWLSAMTDADESFLHQRRRRAGKFPRDTPSSKDLPTPPAARTWSRRDTGFRPSPVCETGGVGEMSVCKAE